jgi:hypothetical protein
MATEADGHGFMRQSANVNAPVCHAFVALAALFEVADVLD